MDPLTSYYDYIIIDCPPSLSLLTVNAMTAANAILIPLQCEFYALEGLSQLLQTVKRIRQGLNPTLEIAGILLTMFDKRTNLSYQVAEDAENHFKAWSSRPWCPVMFVWEKPRASGNRSYCMTPRP